MNRYTYAMFLFFLITLPVVGQEVSPVRKKPSADVVKSAKDIVEQSKGAPIVMPYGGYALIPMEVAAEAFIVPGSDDCLSQQLIPKGKTYEGWLVSKNDPTVWKNIVIAADDKVDRILVRGIDKGTQTIVWHAVVEGKSAIIDAKAFQVGEQKPKPPVPPQPDLTDFEKKLKTTGDADIKAGKGSKEHALLLASVYRSAANALPATSTVGELYKQLQTAFAAAGVPPVAQSLPTMRRAIADELDKRLPTEADKQLTLEDRNRISAAFTSMADSLEAVFPNG